MQRRVVDEETGRLLAVLAQPLPMISTKNDQRVLVQALFLQEAQQAANLSIGESDLSIVRMRFVLLTIRRGWTIWVVWIVQMHPEEKSPLIVLPQPVQHLVGDDVPRPLHFVEIRFLQSVEVEMVVIKVEATVQAEARVQHRRANHSSGCVTVRFQSRRQGRLLRI